MIEPWHGYNEQLKLRRNFQFIIADAFYQTPDSPYDIVSVTTHLVNLISMPWEAEKDYFIGHKLFWGRARVWIC